MDHYTFPIEPFWQDTSSFHLFRLFLVVFLSHEKHGLSMHYKQPTAKLFISSDHNTGTECPLFEIHMYIIILLTLLIMSSVSVRTGNCQNAVCFT